MGSTSFLEFLQEFEVIERTIIPDYLKNLFVFCDYTEYTLRHLNENDIKELESFIRTIMSETVNEENHPTYIGHFPDIKKFVFMPPARHLILQLAKFALTRSQNLQASNTDVVTKKRKVQCIETSKKIDSNDDSKYNLISAGLLNEEVSLKDYLGYWFIQNQIEPPEIDVKVGLDDNQILTAKYRCHKCGLHIMFQKKDSRGWLRQNLYRHIRRHYEKDALESFNSTLITPEITIRNSRQHDRDSALESFNSNLIQDSNNIHMVKMEPFLEIHTDE